MISTRWTPIASPEGFQTFTPPSEGSYFLRDIFTIPAGANGAQMQCPPDDSWFRLDGQAITVPQALYRNSSDQQLLSNRTQLDQCAVYLYEAATLSIQFFTGSAGALR